MGNEHSPMSRGVGEGGRGSDEGLSPNQSFSQRTSRRSNHNYRSNNNNSSSSSSNSSNHKFKSFSSSASMSPSHSPQTQRSPPTHQSLTSEGLSHPIGLTGPTQFEFSPAIKDEDRNSNSNLPQRYLTFLSSHPSSMMYHQQHNPNAYITGSPVRTMGGGGVPGHSEKRLCVMDLKPFYDSIDLMEKDGKDLNSLQQNSTDQKMSSYSDDDDDVSNLNQEDYQNFNFDEKKIVKPISDPNQVMDTYVYHLLNTSLPLNRPNDHQYQMNNYFSPLSPAATSTGSPNNRSYINSPTTSIDEGTNSVKIQLDGAMSLEERLRRERQRLHSHGITQFGWTIYNNKYASSTVNQHKSRRLSPERCHSPSNGFSSLPNEKIIRILVPLRGNIYIQDGLGPNTTSPLRLLYDKSMLEDYIANAQMQQIHNNNKGKKSKKGKQYLIKSVVGRDASAIDPQLSPDGSMVAFVVAGEIYVMSCGDPYNHNNMDDDGHGHNGSNEIFDGRNDYESNSEDMMFIDDHNESIFSAVNKPTRVTFGDSMDENENNRENSSSDEEDSCANPTLTKKRFGRSITHGLADFIAQEEMDRYRGFWWDTESKGILFVRVDESCVPPYRITHQGKDGFAGDESNYEDHRYPFAGENNPEISLGYISLDSELILSQVVRDHYNKRDGKREDNLPSSPNDESNMTTEKSRAELNWLQRVKWFSPPAEASEYLARVNWLPCGSVCVQWQDRRQSKLILVKIDINTGESVLLHQEQSDVWINLHHMFQVLPRTIHPNECLPEYKNQNFDNQIPNGSFSFLFASERTGYCHLYLYTYMPGDCSATFLRAVTAGEWIVESIVGVDLLNDLIYVTGTFDSPLERHLYVLPLRRNKYPKSANVIGVLGVRRGITHVMNSLGNPSRNKYSASTHVYAPPVSAEVPADPIRVTTEAGMHSIVMDDNCRLFVDTSSDLNRPPSSKMYAISKHSIGESSLIFVLYDSSLDLKDDKERIPSPELMSFPTSDGTQTLHAALYLPDQSLHGPGPYPLICAVYGGPHVQRVNRSWSQCVDMRAQRLCSMGFAVAKCDNRGSARRGLEFEGAIRKNLGRVEVLDQVAAVRHLVMKRIADPKRVGIYGWSYGGYLAAMCLCRAPDVFHVAIAGAPVTSWDGYDTHYTERYMGLPSENTSGYHESAIFQHIHNMRGKLMIIHGLIDENVHFRHTARLINKLVMGSKDYDLLIFPNERHSPRRHSDRVYMEKRISDYFIRNLLEKSRNDGLFMGHL